MSEFEERCAFHELEFPIGILEKIPVNVLVWCCPLLSCFLVLPWCWWCLLLSCYLVGLSFVFLSLSCLLFCCLAFCTLVFCSLVLPCLVWSYLALSCLFLSCLVLSCLVLSCLVLSCLDMPHFPFKWQMTKPLEARMQHEGWDLWKAPEILLGWV